MNERIAVVTGASRGLGLGIARALGTKGYTVYLTGRGRGESLTAAAAQVDAVGGRGIALPCDHGDDAEVAAAFAKIDEESGRIDILVNNAAAVHGADLATPEPFWLKPLHMVDMVTVGLRSNYVASYHAAPIMARRKGGLIALVSFYGAVSYFHGPAYGAAKAGTDKMAFDMAIDLREHGVAVNSIWPGFILTDALAAVPAELLSLSLQRKLPGFERPEFTGLVIDALFNDPGSMALSGRALIGAELGARYGLKDIDGKVPRSYARTMGRPRNFGMHRS